MKKMLPKNHLKFLRILCALHDGENYVLESEIRKKWKKCPTHNSIINFGYGTYFEYNLDLDSPGYIPTAQALAYVSDRRLSSLSLLVSVITLIISAITLFLTFLQLL